MTQNIFENIISQTAWFDVFIFFILIYCVIQGIAKGFTLSFVLFMKWIVSLILTIIFLPKLQPIVSDYIDSPFINSMGLGIAIYISSLFILILLGKAFSSSMKWTGFGTMDKTFGFFFGVFKGYVVSVCLFSLINWFYPFNKWSIEVDEALTYNLIKKGSDVLIEEFPNYQDIENTKETIDKI